MTLRPDCSIVISPSVYARAFGDEMVLLDFGRGEYFALDEVGAEVWRGLEAGATPLQIATALTGRYEVGADAALADVLALVTELHAQALVSAKTEAAVAPESGAV